MANRINRKIIWIGAAVLIIALCFGCCAVYLSDYYRADLEAIEAFAVGREVEKAEVADGLIAFGDPHAEIGLIFYPGGKVEYTAYEPLMRSIAANGVLCILVRMPFNLAVLDVNRADAARAQFPEVESWYIGGHSLGGSMAASYLGSHAGELRGLVLLGAYSTADLSGGSAKVLSVYGSADGVMNREKYEQYRDNLPSATTEILIDGGCHAYFGMYGEQEGDGAPSLSAEEQIAISAGYISDFILRR